MKRAGVAIFGKATRFPALFAALAILFAAAEARAALQFRFLPETASDWAPRTTRTVLAQVRSTGGTTTLGAIQLDFTYDATGDAALVGIDQTYVGAGDLSRDLTQAADDGAASFFRGAEFGGADGGWAVDGTWRTFTGLRFAVGAHPAYSIDVVVTLAAALDAGLSPVASAWIGALAFDGGSYAFNDPQTPIELVSFAATAVGGLIRITWETATEADNAGFRLWRAESEGGSYARLSSDLIPSEGSPTQGASYAFEDRSVTPGRTYWYKLEDVDIRGRSTFHGPVSATANRKPLFGCGVARGDGGFGPLLLVAAAGVVLLARRRRSRRPGRRGA
jgi:hypothetical protein